MKFSPGALGTRSPPIVWCGMNNEALVLCPSRICLKGVVVVAASKHLHILSSLRHQSGPLRSECNLKLRLLAVLPFPLPLSVRRSYVHVSAVPVFISHTFDVGRYEAVEGSIALQDSAVDRDHTVSGSRLVNPACISHARVSSGEAELISLERISPGEQIFPMSDHPFLRRQNLALTMLQHNIDQDIYQFHMKGAIVVDNQSVGWTNTRCSKCCITPVLH